MPGDIASTTRHVAIVTGIRLTTGTSSLEFQVVENDWGFRGDEPGGPVVFRRWEGIE
jgi:hypothetical protein